MFKKNSKHLQSDLFGFYNTLPKAMQKKVLQSEEYHFYKIIFSTIDESIFSAVYSDQKSRPNSPINAMVASLLLMNRRTWTYDELFKNIQFHLLVKIALGLDQISDVPFCVATLFNFQNRLHRHFIETGENLLERVFDQLTEDQIKKLKLKTDIQRTDSFAALSNIRNYSRLQLLIEMIIRIYRVLSDKDQQRFIDQFRAYTNKTSGQYIYSLKSEDVTHEMKKVGQLYAWIDQTLYPLYKEFQIFQTFQLVFTEHFTVVDQKIEIKPPDQLKSDSVQSPDDLDAAYRKKNNKSGKGQSVNIVETADPSNPIQLLTDVAVNPLNKDDNRVLHKRLDRLKEKNPALAELHHDAAYGSADNDLRCEQLDIATIQTAVRGNQSAVPIVIEQVSESDYVVKCPLQTVQSLKARKRFKVSFDLLVCEQCEYQGKCPALVMKNYRVYYFTHDIYLSKKRQRVIETLPPERQKLRSNVEATINEFVCKMPKRKLKVRGAFKTAVFAYSVAMSVNFGRIFRLIQANPVKYLRILTTFVKIVKEQMGLIFSLLPNPIKKLLDYVSFQFVNVPVFK